MAAKMINESGTEPGIKRLLRHRESRAYFCHGDWTRKIEEADEFDDVLEAAEACVRYGLNGVEVAVRLETADCDLFTTAIR